MGIARRRIASVATFGSIRAALPPAGPNQRVGIIGGSFDPPHAAHQQMVATARRRLGLDQVWWLVTPGNPLKMIKGRAPAPLESRVLALRMFANHPRDHISGLEQHLPTRFTAATLAYIVRRRPDVHFVWIMGADGLLTFEHWLDWQTIADLMPVVVVDRPGYRLKSLASRPAHVMARRRLPEFAARLLPGMHAPASTFLSTRLSPLSSTALRAQRPTKPAQQVVAEKTVTLPE